MPSPTEESSGLQHMERDRTVLLVIPQNVRFLLYSKQDTILFNHFPLV